MNAHRSHSDPHAHRTRISRHAPLNSVSTRIILCVFLSTLLTAMIVSWLSVGAVHGDVRSRVTNQTRALLAERGNEIEGWQAAASAQLAATAAAGTSWNSALLTALDENPRRAVIGLHWVNQGRDASSRDDALPPNLELPVPPPELARYFQRITVRSSGGDGSAAAQNDAGCLSSQSDLVDANLAVVGRVEGCLLEDSLYTYLQPVVGEVRGTRLLAVDSTGRVRAAGGVRSSARIGEKLPTPGQGFISDGNLTTYSTPKGVTMVGGINPIGRTGWHVVVETEKATAFAPAIAIMNQIFIVDVCIILLFSILAYKITIAIMQPIEALSEGAQRIAEGQMDYQIPLPANNDDELGLLTRTFNLMMAKLRSNQLEIEQDRVRLGEKNDELQRANEILSQLSITDGLTKLHNHRYFQDHLTREIKRVSRTESPLSLILIDIDDFKLLNDTHGHAAGDEVLVSLAAIMNDSARESDLIARYGGEEFVILMPNTDLAGAVHLAEKIRMAVETTRLIIGDNMKPIDITISLGVALFTGDRREFFAEADRALYRAKAAGKNCVIIAGSEPDEIA
jgi:diguanylate cyclase (GGDEF)-like protein